MNECFFKCFPWPAARQAQGGAGGAGCGSGLARSQGQGRSRQHAEAAGVGGGVCHEAGEPVQDEYTVLRGKVTRTCRGQKGWGTADTSVVFTSARGEVNLSTRRDAEERELEGGSGPRPGGPPLPL